MHKFQSMSKLMVWNSNLALKAVILFDLTLNVPVSNFFSYIWTGLPGLNQYYASLNLSCSRTQHSESNESRTRWPLGLDLSTL